jgi:hypothetical protein
VGVDENLVLVARTLRLLIEVQELVLTNKPLRAVWRERSDGILAMVYKLFVESTGQCFSLFVQSCLTTLCRFDAPDTSKANLSLHDR